VNGEPFQALGKNFAYLSLESDSSATDTASEGEEDISSCPAPFLELCELPGGPPRQMSLEDCQKIEEATRGQATNPTWFSHRRGRITGSIAGRIARRVTADETIIAEVLGYSSAPTTAAMREGRLKVRNI
jgi:hypothetical protein